MPNLDALIEASAIQAELATGLNPRQIAASNGRHVAVLSKSIRVHVGGPLANQWRSDEDAFLRANLGYLSDDEIGRFLGRTSVAVHLRWKRDLRLTAPSKAPDVLTANQISNGLGADEHMVTSWIDRGLLPGRRLPYKDVTRVVNRTTFLRWLVNPDNWIYFDHAKVGLPVDIQRGAKCYDHAFWQKARRLLALARSRWEDEWWTTNQAADYHGVTNKDILRYIAHSKLHAVQVKNFSGRHHNPTWSYWFVRRSEAKRVTFYFGKGHNPRALFTESADAFLILARAVGLPLSSIARMMKSESKCLGAHLLYLHRRGHIHGLIRKHKLNVRYDKRTGRLFARWQDHQRRFPSLARLVCRFKRGDRAFTRAQLQTIVGVFQAWAYRDARTSAQKKFAKNLFALGRRNADHLRVLRQQLKGWGADPLRLRP